MTGNGSQPTGCPRIGDSVSTHLGTFLTFGKNENYAPRDPVAIADDFLAIEAFHRKQGKTVSFLAPPPVEGNRQTRRRAAALRRTRK